MYNDPNNPQQQPPYGQPPQQQPYNPAQYNQPPQSPPFGPGQYNQPPQQPPFGPGQYNQPPQQKKSKKWLWITLGIIGGILVLSCVGCAVLGRLGVNVLGQVAGPALAITQYETAIKNQDYPQAFTYLDTSNLSTSQQDVAKQFYVLAEQGIDKRLGPLTDFKITNTTVNNNTATVTVQETRGSRVVNATYHLRQIGNEWKINPSNNAAPAS